MSDRRFDTRRLPGAATIAIFCLVVLYIPLFILVINSLNASASASRWEGVSLSWYSLAIHNESFLNAATNSLVLAMAAAAIATVTATLGALATTRSRNFKAENTINLILNQPLMVPEIVLAIALLIIFAQIKQATNYNGMAYLVVAHSAFCIPFAYMPVRARLQSMDLTLETAAADLYAGRIYTFRKVTLPLLAPAVLAGFMLAFVVSLDDVVISQFLKSPGQDTLPTYLLGQLKRNLTSEIYAISSLLLLLSVLIVAGSWLLTRRKT